MKHAIIDNSGNIVNVIELDYGSTWTPPDGFISIKSEAAIIGGTYSEGNFIAPSLPELVPPTINEKIVALESGITIRRLREAGSDSAGGSLSGRCWMKEIETKITELRAELTQ